MATEGNIEAVRRERKVTRSLFTKNANILEKFLNAHPDEKDSFRITAQYTKVLELQSLLVELDKDIRKLIRDGDESVLEQEMESAVEYRTRWITLDMTYKDWNKRINPVTESTTKRNFKLPTLQFITFDGELKNWLPFWGQFQKIDKDPLIDIHDKYQYLLQAMKEDTEPRALVKSFSPTSYKECLSQLKSRYAREELLIQVYVRELLGLINKVENSNLTSLFDKINAMLRALETLGVTKDKFAAFLLPMIESALPEELLTIWERNKKENEDISTEMNNLLHFMKKEVESEQRVLLAKKTYSAENKTTSPEPTAGCLLTNTNSINSKKSICVWCEKDSHNSLECFKMQKMNVEERRNHLKQKKACAICLRKGHHPKVCKASVKCLLCGQRHSVVLCTNRGQKASENVPSTKRSAAQPEASSATTSATASNKASSTKMSTGAKQTTETTLLQTVSVLVCNGQKQVMVRAMFDNGAQRSYIREDVIRKLDISAVGNTLLSHTLFGGVEITPKPYKAYDLQIKSIDNTFSFNLTALGQTCICLNIPKYTNDNLSQLLTKHNITLSDKSTNTNEIGLLIGADFSGLVLTGDMVRLHDSLVAIKTKLGWTLQGKITSPPSTNMQAAHVAMFCSADLSNFWSLETLGIRDPTETKTKQQSEEEVLANFEENVKVNEEGRYEVLLPWKVGHDELLNNYDVASRRLESVTKRLMTNNMKEDYDKVFKEWSDKGIIEMVPDPKTELESSHYLPHRPVIKEKSLTTRIRPVFDASAKDRHGKSLNLCLDKGINMLDKIPKLLNGFRKRAIGVTADISKAFLQVSVSPKDRDMLRFLWWDDDGNIITYRHCRVVFGLTSSPFLLSATIQHHLNQVGGELRGSADILTDSFYVDNCQTSLDTEEAAMKFQTEAKDIMSQAKFDLTQWTIAPLSSQKDDAVIPILGLEWHTAKDELSCNIQDFPPLCELGKITKRNLLSLTQRIYDPIGFTAAVTLVPRLILQEAWHRKLSWDEELPDDLKKKFINWYESLHYLKYCKIPRRLTLTLFDESSLQLHMFCDASRDGYAACVYLRAENKGNVSVQIISAKSRVAPPEKLTIPRLELLAALIGSRMLAEARKDLRLDCEEYCWTDSGVALCWIKKELTWNTYVGNRVKEIRNNTNSDNWFHIPGTSNWADLASRGCDAAQLLSSRWLEGPPWLRTTPGEWPKSSLAIDEAEASRELKKTALCHTNTNPNEGMTNQLTYFSKYNKIIRTVAWMLRFAHNARHKNKMRGELSYEEYEEGEKRVIKLIQTENRDYIEKKIQGVTNFYDKDGLLRVKTKLLLTDVPESTKFPAVLPATNCITRRLVEQRHAQLQHAGLGTVLADLRARYWIVGARHLVKSVITHCNICKRHRAKPMRAPAAPLPVERTQCNAPFEITGVDLAGPLYLRGGEKCWIVIYTCAVYRAVHLEVTKSLSTEAFLMTLRRFIARRGRVSVMISDNGTNLVGTKNLLSDLDWNEVQRQSTIQRIKWKLNAPTAAWWGGFWERLIKILKDLLKRVLGKSAVTYVELETILCDCESTMNARPLTYIEDEKMTSLEPLTPMSFLQPISQTEVTDIDVIDSRSLNRRMQYLQKLREDFRQRFKAEYLTTLVQKGREKQDRLKVGDVVLVETEEKRIKWPLGIVEEIFTGRDDINRTARVRMSTGYKVRPFQRLFKLEVTDPETEFPSCGLESSGKVIPAIQSQPEQTKVRKEKPIAIEKATRSGRIARMPSRYLI